MKIRHIRTLEDISASELISLLDRADTFALQRVADPSAPQKPLENKSIAIILEKASTRTRISFEVGIRELGGFPITLISATTQMGRGEPLADTARMLNGYVHGAIYRTFGHDRILELCQHAKIPIINGLSDEYHPCQLLADLQTIRTEFSRLEGLRVTWIGDGNNMAHSWILAAARTGLRLCLCCPQGYEPNPSILQRGRELGADIQYTHDPKEAARNADVVTTDVWASMGQEEETAARKKAFVGFQVNKELMNTASEKAIFLHCLPAHRGEEVTADVIDGAYSRVWKEAENRLHAQKALLEFVLS